MIDDRDGTVLGSIPDFRTLVESAHDVLWVFDLELGYTYISPSVRHMRGYEVGEAMRLGLDQVLAPESYRRAMEMFAMEKELELKGHRHEPGWATTEEFEMMRKDGSTFWAEVTVNLLYSERGSIRGIMGITRDISGRRHAEEELRRYKEDLEATVRERTLELVHTNERLREEIRGRERVEKELRESAEKYRIHFSLTNDVMFSYDNQFRVLSVSSNVERVLGYRPEELVGKTFQEADVLDPESLPVAFENALKILAGNPVYSSIYLFITRDGRRRYGEVSGVPCMQDGRVYAVTTVARDVTERMEMANAIKESEERYRVTLEGMPAAVSIVRVSDSRLLYVNEAFSRITGYTADEALGRTLSELDLPHAQASGARSGDLDGAFAASDNTGSRLRRKDGALLDVQVSTRPVHYDSQDCLVMVITDVTDLRQIEEERRRLEMQSQKMESIATLARGIAHDFNNILTSIIGYTGMSLRDISGLKGSTKEVEAVLKDLEEVRRAADRASVLVNHILAFSRHPEREPVPVDLCKLTAGSTKTLRQTLPPSITIREDLSETCMIMGDAAQMHQVLANLFANAAQAMEKTGGQITVSLHRAIVLDDAASVLGLAPGPYVKLTVRDTGPGISPKLMSRIFDPYFTTRWKGEGSGLGLSIVHGIVKGHGGVVNCVSEPGEGACFEVYIPEYCYEKDLSTHSGCSKKERDEKVIDLDGDLPPAQEGKTKGAPRHIRQSKDRPS
jgi:PAS domain S-box-containing protein